MKDNQTENKKAVKNHKDLLVWSKAIEIADYVFQITKAFPPDERFGLISQMNRAAVSVASNIAEGFYRQHTKEYIQFCYIALGSCAEIDTQLIIAKRRNYVDENKFVRLTEFLDHEVRMLRKMIKSLRESA